MKKSTANIICIFFDLFAVAAVYILVYQPLREVFTAIKNDAQFVKYNTNFYIAFACMGIPVLHMLGLIETYLPRYFNRSVFTKVFFGLLIAFMLVGIGSAVIVKRAITYNGYFHCEGAAVHRKLLRIETYVLDDATCRQLTLEREKRKFIGRR